MKKIVIVMALAIIGCSNAMLAQKKTEVVMSDKTGWHKIGETTVDFKTEKEEVMVMGANRFASIKFKVANAPIDIISTEIYYESGDNQMVNLNYSIKAPGESSIVNLNGGERNLKKIVFVYKTPPNYKDAKSHVEIWGLKTNTDKK
ncbi:MAG TPA: hypothetical protein VN698_05855 [Bacteroidia bacterium]|nr:hypothetical protein [Bacteroidia bacterium]